MLKRLWIVVMSFGLLVGLAVPVKAQDTAACDETQVRANVERVIEEGFNQGNTAVVDELFTEEYIAHPDETDREDFKSQIDTIRTAIPNGQATIDHLLVEGCDVFFSFHDSGVMEGELAAPGEQPIPATGKNLHFDAHIYLHLNEAGQVVEEWDYQDFLPFATQLGLIPAQEGTPMAEATEPPMSDETVSVGGNETRNAEVVRQAFEGGFNTGDLDALRGVYSPDFVGHSSDGSTQSLDEFVNTVPVFRNALTDATITINGSVAEGDYVASRVTFSGTFEHELVFPDAQPIPPTGKPFSIEMSFLHRLTPDGLIAEDWEVYDNASFLGQLGLFNMQGMETTPEATP
jgi:predicted ester cyclase